MSIECAFNAFCASDAEAKISQAGKAWTRLRAGVGQGDDTTWVSVAVFGKHAEAAAALKKGDKVYIEGNLKLDSWTGNDGTDRTGLSVAAWKCERTHLIGQNKRPREHKSQPERASQGERANDFHDDEISF